MHMNNDNNSNNNKDNNRSGTQYIYIVVYYFYLLRIYDARGRCCVRHCLIHLIPAHNEVRKNIEVFSVDEEVAIAIREGKVH